MIEIEYVIYEDLMIYKNGSDRMYDGYFFQQWENSDHYKCIHGNSKTIKLKSGKAVNRDRLYNFCFNGGVL